MAIGDGLIRRMVAEALGTFILVFAGVGALMTLGGGIDPLSSIFGFGFALLVVVYSMGHISGAHVNPAVTLGLAVTGRFPMMEVPYYWVSQVFGSLVAAVVLRMLYGEVNGFGVTQVSDAYSVLNGFAVELIAAALLVFVYHAIATDKRSEAAVAGIAIGGAYLLIQVFAGGVSGASVNPARSLGPAVISGNFHDLWIYLTAPFIGGVIGAVLYEFIRGDGDRPPGEAISPADLARRFRPQPRPNAPMGGAEQRPRRQQPRRQDGAPQGEPGQQRQRRPQRPVQEPVYEEDFGAEPAYEEDLGPAPARPQQQRPQRQPFDPNVPQRPQQQTRRRPQQ